MTRNILLGLLLCASACKEPQPDPNAAPPPTTLDQVPGHDQVTQDNTHKEPPRLVPAETYIRTYLKLFGGLTALQAQTQLAAGGSGLFDSWNSYLGALGLPTYIVDLPRKEETNALMVATFERLGIALCDKAMEFDTPKQVSERLIFAFEMSKTQLEPSKESFAPKFDVLHRTFLGYPAKLAPNGDRTEKFYTTYLEVAKRHATDSRFTAAQAAWAATCYGLVRHPEFHLY
jgi:hypothetical protein